MATKSAATFKNADMVSKLVNANATFAFDLYKELLKEKPEGNMFFSPLSISSAFAMVHLGARGNTAAQMEEVLKFGSLDKGQVHAAFEDFNATFLNPDSPYVLRTANRLFARKDYTFLQDFLDATKQYYNAETTVKDFVGNAEGSRAEINQWVEEQTANKIKDLLPSGFIDALTALVLVNCIYFKADWDEKFDEKHTHKSQFRKLNDDVIDVDFMYINREFRAVYNEELECKALELPYKNKDLSMVIVLPDKVGGLAELEKKLTADHIQTFTKNMRSIDIDVNFPKFKLEQQFTLNDILMALGMKDIFVDGLADLSGMDGTKKLSVSSAIHKAFIEVNEEGSEAAAATGIGIALMCMPEYFEFSACHPFMFFIKDNRSDGILFMGRVADPTLT